MLPAYKYTELTTYSGNTKIYIVRKKKIVSEYERCVQAQKCLGVILIIIGIIGFIAFPEDNGGFFISSLMGITRLIFD